jgi:hypothetical protein
MLVFLADYSENESNVDCAESWGERNDKRSRELPQLYLPTSL